VSRDEIALRAWAEPLESTHSAARATPTVITPFQFALVIDTETTTDATQALLFGSYRFISLDDAKHPPGSCLEEGIFYADDLPVRDPQGFSILQRYASDNEADLDVRRYRKPLKFCSRREFVRQVFFQAAYRARALVVGFNLPFDLSRLAIDVSDARRSYGGGFSFTLWDYQDADGVWRPDPNRPRLIIKSLNSKQHLFRFTDRRAGDPEDYDTDKTESGEKRRTAFSGHFLDLRTLAFALTDRGYSLETACRDFAVEHPKMKAEIHGVITPEYIDYNRRDVKATGELLVKLQAEFARHPIPLQSTKAFSPAALGKAYQHAMRLQPVLARQPGFPREILGAAMSSFFGGRAECRIRREPMPVVYTDFVSMYPTVNALLGNWSLLTAREIRVVDATEEVRDFLNGVELEDCFRPETWQQLQAFVKVRADGEIYPVRVTYDPHGQSWQIGSNPLKSADPLWFALPDVVTAKLLSHRTPEVVEAFRLVADGQQKGLRETKLRGLVSVDPRSQDFFRHVIEERKHTQDNPKLDENERARLDKALKVLANAGSYGIYAEMNRKELPGNTAVPVRVWNCAGRQFETRVTAPEEPGPYCFPPIAALITSAARLMLALLECSVREHGGSHVFCDTDSLAIVASESGGLIACPGGQHRTSDGREAVKALSWQEVEQVRQRFVTLNPYDRHAVPGSILKAEDENFDEQTGEQRELNCYSISAKRYVLYTLDGDARATIHRYSGHGLGHLLNPLDPDDRDNSWLESVWHYILEVDVLGRDPKEPAWFARPAITRVGVNDPRTLALFTTLNKGKPYAAQIKPQNFMLSTQVALLGHPPGVDAARFHLVAPYNPDPRQWLKLRWIDRYSGKSYQVTTGDAQGEGVARIKTYGDVVLEYRFHREHKSLAPDGGPCTRITSGLLPRRPVEAFRIVYVGKESNRLEDVQNGLIEDEDEVMTEYRDPSNDPFVRLVVPVLKSMSPRAVAEASAINVRTLRRNLSGRSQPRKQNRVALTALAVEEARACLSTAGIDAPREDHAALHVYIEIMDVQVRTCPVCGETVRNTKAVYCSARCRKRESRLRSNQPRNVG
jgi:hypothetical protein